MGETRSLNSKKNQAKKKKVLKADGQKEEADGNIAKKDVQKSGKKVLSKHKKRKDASKTKKKGAKSLSTKKATAKEKTRKTKPSKRKGKTSAASHHPKTKSDKLLHHLKPQTKGDDRFKSSAMKDRILEVNVDYIETFIGIELAFSLIWLLGSFELILFGFSAFPSVLISVAAFLSTLPGLVVLLRFEKPEHGIFAFSIGQLICGFIELYWIAVVWYDSVSYSSETRTTTCCMQILVIYQFIATFFCNWRPYRKVNPKKFAKKCKNSVTEKLNGDKKKKSKEAKHQKNRDSSESSILSFDSDNLSKTNSKPPSIWEICNDKLVTPNVRPSNSKDMSLSDAASDKPRKTVSNESVLLQSKKSKRHYAPKEYTPSMMSTPNKKREMSLEKRDNEVAFNLPTSSNPPSATSLNNTVLRNTPSDVGSINAEFAGVTPIRKLSEETNQSKTPNSVSGSVYVSPTLR